MAKNILIVDDEIMITTTLSSLIKIMTKHNVTAYNNPVEALESLKSRRVDLIISDFFMPKLNGLEFLKKVREFDQEVEMILLTEYADNENAIRSINEVGIYYYMEKPWDNNLLIKIINNGIEKKHLNETLNNKIAELEKSNNQITLLNQLLKNEYDKEIENTYNLIISLANVIEAKDSYTNGHTQRVGELCRALGEKLGLSQEELRYIQMAGNIHDIGKVGVPESILNKPGKLTNEEFEIMKKHALIGENICRPLLSMSKCLDAVRHHHEKLDGSGYPDGLSGNEISLHARILAVADIFDALYSGRPYRNKLISMGKIKDIFLEEVNAGKIDGDIVSLLFKLIDSSEIYEIVKIL